MEYYDFYQKFHEMDPKTAYTTETNSLNSLLNTITKKNVKRDLFKELTPTEKKICVGLALGLTAKEIAKARGSSNRTIETHIANIKMKADCKRLPPILLMRLISSCLSTE